MRASIDGRLAAIFADRDATAGLRKANQLAKNLQLAHPDAAASLREGLEEMFTVTRIGASDTLRRSLTTTNAIESMISTCRNTTSNVKNWQSGEMRRRWCAAGMLEAERSFRRIKGHKEIGIFTKKLRNKLTENTEIVTPPTYTYTAA